MADTVNQPHTSLSIPPYLRPPASRQHSNTSSLSARSGSRRPHPQHTEYIPANTDVAFEGGIEDVFTEHAMQDEAAAAGDSGITDRSSGEVAGDDWDNLRDGSIARRPAWRRPSPAWVYPFLVGIAVALGTTAAPRSELYINLACLSHPPHASSSVSQYSAMAQSGKRFAIQEQFEVHIAGDDTITINSTVPRFEKDDHMDSPGDAWFRKVQHDIYEYERNHRLIHSNPSTAVSSSRSSGSFTSHALPTNPLPHATMTMPGEEQPTSTEEGSRGPYPTSRPDDPSTGEDEDEDEGSTPYQEIDPKLCKKDPKVQGAAARLTMS
jgi:hypothetical protein